MIKGVTRLLGAQQVDEAGVDDALLPHVSLRRLAVVLWLYRLVPNAYRNLLKSAQNPGGRSSSTSAFVQGTWPGWKVGHLRVMAKFIGIFGIGSAG